MLPVCTVLGFIPHCCCHSTPAQSTPVLVTQRMLYPEPPGYLSLSKHLTGHTFQYATLSTPNSHPPYPPPPPQYPNPPPPPHPTRPIIPAQWRRCCVRPSGGLRPAPPLLLPVPTAPANTQPTHTSTRWCTADAGVSRGPAAQYFSVTPGEGGQGGHPLSHVHAYSRPPQGRSLGAPHRKSHQWPVMGMARG